MSIKMELLTAKELANILKIDRTTIYRMVKRGMPYKVVGARKRFILEDVLKWQEENKKGE